MAVEENTIEEVAKKPLTKEEILEQKMNLFAKEFIKLKAETSTGRLELLSHRLGKQAIENGKCPTLSSRLVVFKKDWEEFLQFLGYLEIKYVVGCYENGNPSIFVSLDSKMDTFLDKNPLLTISQIIGQSLFPK